MLLFSAFFMYAGNMPGFFSADLRFSGMGNVLAVFHRM